MKPGHRTQIERRSIFPFDLSSFPLPRLGPPLLNLATTALLQDLTEDYLQAKLCEAGLHSFSAENEMRMEAMTSARNQIEHQLSSLLATQRIVRQEEITAEIIEIAAGETASRPKSKGALQAQGSRT